MVLIATVMLFQFSGCKESEDPGPNNGGDEPNVKISSGTLVDADGFTLYFFTRDVSGESSCEGGCLTNWPVFYEESLKVSDDLNSADFGTIDRGGGVMQTTYKGWPLYYFANDAAAGDTNGDGVGTVWYVAKPDYSIMLANSQLVGNDGKNYTSTYTEGDGETQFFVDNEGNTLYAFKKDTENQNNFTASDFSNNGSWPIFNVAISSLPSSINASDFATINVHGESQLTYKGWPLYYFGGDATRGETKGVSVPSPGVWPIVNTETTSAPPPPPTVLTAEDGTFGTIITDGNGVSLYYFSKDVGGASNCEGGCLDFWPKFNAGEIILSEGSLLNAADFGTIGEGENMQTTYKGWPLYYFSPGGDGEVEAAGATAGDGVNGIWFIANPDYSLMVADAQLIGHDGKNYLDDYTEGDGMTKYFTDAEGRTIYIFKNDSKDTNTFTSSDFSNNSVWPIFHIDIDKLPSEINAADFGEIDVFGETQLTYKGWPLYYFGQDATRGENKGVSFPSPGVWPIINNDTGAAPE